MTDEAADSTATDALAAPDLSTYCGGGKRHRVPVIKDTHTAQCPDCKRILRVRPGAGGMATIARHKPQQADEQAPLALDDDLRSESDQIATLRAENDRLRARLEATDIDLRAALARYDGYHAETTDSLAQLHDALDESQARYLAAESALAARDEAAGLDPIVTAPEFIPGIPERDLPTLEDAAVANASDSARTVRSHLAFEEARMVARYHRGCWPPDECDALEDLRGVHHLAERALRKALDARDAVLSRRPAALSRI